MHKYSSPIFCYQPKTRSANEAKIDAKKEKIDIKANEDIELKDIINSPQASSPGTSSTSCPKESPNSPSKPDIYLISNPSSIFSTSIFQIGPALHS